MSELIETRWSRHGNDRVYVKRVDGVQLGYVELLRSLSVTSAIVFVDAAAFTVKQMPADVHVTTRRRLVGWLQSLPETIDETTVEAIFATARLSTTWTTDTAHAVE